MRQNKQCVSIQSIFGYNMTEYANDASKYELFGIVNHSGTPSFGHYVAYVRPNMQRNWCRFDDTNVDVVSDRTPSKQILAMEKELAMSFYWSTFVKIAMKFSNQYPKIRFPSVSE